MSGFFSALLEHAFLQNALLAGLLASVGCGVVGSYVVVKRIGYLAGGIAHAVLGGMGLAYFFEFPPLAGALGAATVAALIIGWVKLRWRQQEDTLIGALWAVGMAIGILFISRTPGYNVDLMSYLFGNILMVSSQEVILMAVLDLILVGLVVLFYKPLLAVAFDEELAELRGLNVELFYMLLLCMVALTVVLLIQVVGLILVIALLTLPAAIGLFFVRSLPRLMLVSVGLGALFSASGLAVSYGPDLPAGSTIILLAGLGYLLAAFGSGIWKKHRAARRRLPTTSS